MSKFDERKLKTNSLVNGLLTLLDKSCQELESKWKNIINSEQLEGKNELAIVHFRYIEIHS